METILALIMENTLPAVLIAYYIWKDYKFTGQITTILSEIRSVLNVLKDVEIAK